MTAAHLHADASTILVGAAQCWREARDRRELVQPCLARTLGPHDAPILAPVLDSLFRCYEQALGRRFDCEDDDLLVGLIGGTLPRHCMECPAGAGATLDCAICSTRIMLALAARPI